MFGHKLPNGQIGSAFGRSMQIQAPAPLITVTKPVDLIGHIYKNQQVQVDLSRWRCPESNLKAKQSIVG